MQDADFLFIVAEVAVAFAGFASIVAAIGQRNTRDDPRIDASRLRGLLECSLLAVAFSLLPYALHRVVVLESTAWRISSAVFAITAGVVAAGMRQRTRRLGGVAVPLRIRAMVLGFYMTPLPVLALLAFGIGDAGLYLLCLLSYLFGAGIAFLRVMLSFLEALREQSDDAV